MAVPASVAVPIGGVSAPSVGAAGFLVAASELFEVVFYSF